MRIYKEKAGTIAGESVWVAIHDGYLYTAPTKKKLATLLATEWRNPKHLIGQKRCYWTGNK